jgi:hypothetical protein
VFKREETPDAANGHATERCVPVHSRINVEDGVAPLVRVIPQRNTAHHLPVHASRASKLAGGVVDSSGRWMDGNLAVEPREVIHRNVVRGQVRVVAAVAVVKKATDKKGEGGVVYGIREHR